MPTDKRQRKKRVRDVRQQQAFLKARKKRRGRLVGVGAGIALAGAIAFILATVLNYSSTQKPTVATKSTTSTSSDLGADPTCPRADGRSVRVVKFRRAPPICTDASHTYKAHVTTDLGDFVITLSPSRAPDAVNNFVFLVRYHFYDGLTFNKIIPGSYIQTGNPPGEPTDAGYLFGDELPNPGEYQVGSVMMANAGPNTNGSQFIILTGPDILPKLNPPKFSLFGSVTEGMDVVTRLSADANATHVVREITITES